MPSTRLVGRGLSTTIPTATRATTRAVPLRAPRLRSAEYVSIKEQDEVMRTFRVVSVREID